MRRPARHPDRQLRWSIWLCVAALLAFQSLGLIHRALHGGAPPANRAALAYGIGESWSPGAALSNWVAQASFPIIGSSSPRALLPDPQRPQPAASAQAASPSPWTLQSSVASAFGHLAGSADCQLLDQLSQALGPIFQAQPWTLWLPDAPVSTTQPLSAPTVALWRHDARGPPTA